MNNIITRKIKATYQGPEHPALDKEAEVELKLHIIRKTGEMETYFNDDKTSIRYPSKKKFLEHWIPEEGWESGATIYKMPRREQKQKGSEITLADAGAVIYTEVVAAINRFNKKSEETYKDENEWKRPYFELRLEKQVYNDDTQELKNLYGAGVLMFEIKQFGQKRIIYSDGISFPTERDMENINAYSPKLYINFLDSLVESALLYAVALNPDDPENLKTIEDATKQQEDSTIQRIGE